MKGHAVYTKCAVNLYNDPEHLSLGALIEKGTPLLVTDDKAALNPDGTVRMSAVSAGSVSGYLRPWYLTEDISNGEDEFTRIHRQREDSLCLGGGEPGSLDYHPREKSGLPDPGPLKTILLNLDTDLSTIDKFIDLIKGSGVNAFAINLSDFWTVSYESEVMQAYSPTSYRRALCNRKNFKEMVHRIKSAGLYCIGTMSAFQDTGICIDHPEWAITDVHGRNIRLDGGYWASPYHRSVWEYKVKLAAEAAEWFGLDEIQFDYVRFPTGIWKLVSEGRIDLKNKYNENKAQAIQRFLMYAADILHEKGCRISAAVFGETALDYVTSYGQYWPAISNIVDSISAMPYCDCYSIDDWIPWEHPYETVKQFAEKAVLRQSECPTPAKDRTWIQCYDSVKAPKVMYGPEQVQVEINALADGGMKGGFITFNLYGYEKYRALIHAGVL